MLNNIITDFTGSAHTGRLSEGCRLCHIGAKMVLFVTGLCGRGCFYCPVSEEKRGKDIVYANERPVLTDSDVIEEVKRMGALGTGITGGEPLVRLDRTLHYIKLLKSEFGNKHHIHLYTCVAPDDETLVKLKEAGLDEIRFHPPVDTWDTFRETLFNHALRYAKEIGLDAGVEIPAIKSVPEIERAIRDMNGFLNLNELEYSDTNSDKMRALGYVLRDDVSNAVKGSEELALEIVLNTIANTRYCSSRFKDAVQLRERLKRTAQNVARSFDEISDDGTIIYGEITGDLTDAIHFLNDAQVPADMYVSYADRIEIAWWILEDIAEDLGSGMNKSIVERYPMENGLVVERIPL